MGHSNLHITPGNETERGSLLGKKGKRNRGKRKREHPWERCGGETGKHEGSILYLPRFQTTYHPFFLLVHCDNKLFREYERYTRLKNISPISHPKWHI